MFKLLKLLLALAIGYILLTPPAEAGTAPLQGLFSLDDSRGWEGVGRVNIGTRAFCTGALVAENLVLTAAHCMFDHDTGKRVDEGEIEFLAGWRSGRASAYRGVRRVIVHPDYVYATDRLEQRVRYDLALLELDQPIRSRAIRPFAVAAQPAKGAQVGVVSYAFDRADRPSLQQGCKVLARQSGALVMSCNVDFGSSGAPVFVYRNGQPQIVSVVSAKAMARDIPVSLGTSLQQPLADMMAMLAASDGVFSRPRQAVRILSPQGNTAASGAKFVRP